MSCKVISLVNQKGGVGKTTSSINLSSSLAFYDKKVLLIDLDPQGNTSQGLNIDKSIDKANIFDVLTTDISLNSVISNSYMKNLDVIPANINLAGADSLLYNVENSHNILKTKMEAIKDNYDFIIIDCPPSLSKLTINALVASDSVIIPVQCEFFALEGLTQLLDTIVLVQEKYNPYLYIQGILPTMFDKRLRLAKDTLDDLKRFFGERVFDPIPRTTKIASSPAYGLAMIDFDKKNVGTQKYLEAALEVINYE